MLVQGSRQFEMRVEIAIGQAEAANDPRNEARGFGETKGGANKNVAQNERRFSVGHLGISNFDRPDNSSKT